MVFIYSLHFWFLLLLLFSFSILPLDFGKLGCLWDELQVDSVYEGRLHVPHVGGRKGERKTAVIQLENVQDGPDSKFKGSWALVM